MDKNQNRFTSPVLWISLFMLIVNQLGLHQLLGLDEGNLKIITDSLITILLATGIINNPVARDKF